MKKFLLILSVLTITQTISAQKYSVRHGSKPTVKNDSVYTIQQHLALSGRYLQRSAACDELAWGLIAASGISYSGVVFEDRRTANVLGTIFAIGAVSAKVASITLKHKSGTELRLTAVGMTLNF